MGSILHGSARTTPRLRAELQASQESTWSLAARYGLNPKTVAKWRERTTTADALMGPSLRLNRIGSADGRRNHRHALSIARPQGKGGWPNIFIAGCKNILR
jgi:hypothetical protein